MFENWTHAVNTIIAQTNQNWEILGAVLGILWGVHLLNILVGYRLNVLGIIPRKMNGLVGIIFAPFLHGNFNHLFFNSIPLVVLLDFILIFNKAHWMCVTAAITLIGGFLTWIIARKSIHIGASGVITGYWSYLICNMYTEPSVMTLILGVVCVYYFAGIFLGVFPQGRGTSWEGHMSGLIAGGVVAFFPILGTLF